MNQYRVTLKATRKPHRGRHFTYVIDASTKVEAIDLAKQYARSLDRVETSALYKCEDMSHAAA